MEVAFNGSVVHNTSMVLSHPKTCKAPFRDLARVPICSDALCFFLVLATAALNLIETRTLL